MDVRQLKYFVSVLDHKSFTKAANVLRIAQPALGLQIRKLEEELNVQLLVRHSRGVTPTEAGLILLERARTIIDQIESAKSALQDMAPVASGRVVVGMAPSIAAMLAHSLVRDATRTLPNVALVIVEELSPVLSEWLGNGRLDIAIGYEMLDSANVVGDPLLLEDVYLVQAPSALPRLGEYVPMRDLGNYDLIVPSNPHGMRGALDKHAAELGIELNIRCEMESVHVTKDLVEQGIGATIAPYGAVYRECRDGRLVAAKLVEPGIRRMACIVHSARRAPSLAVTAVTALVRDLVSREVRPNGLPWQSTAAFRALSESAAA